MNLTVLLVHFIPGQNTPKSYHNMKIDQEWLKGSVYELFLTRSSQAKATFKY